VIFVAYFLAAFTMLFLCKKPVKGERLLLSGRKKDFNIFIMIYGKIIFKMVLWIYIK